MHILKMLAPLEDLEARMAELYEWLSGVFNDDKDASSFFYRVSVEEVVHVNIIKYQRRLVSTNPKVFGEIDIDTGLISQIASEISTFRNAPEAPSLRDALRKAIEFEHSIAEEHCRTLLEQAHPEVRNLLRGLGAFDSRHIESFHEFAAMRGYDDLSDNFRILRAEDDLQYRGTEEVYGKKASELGKVFLERLEYLSEWHGTMGYYKFLGVREYAGEEQIKHAYLQMMKEFHPDRYFGYPAEITDKLKEIAAYAVDAHETLLNPAKRKAYDSSRLSVVRH